MLSYALIEQPEYLNLFEELYHKYAQGLYYDAKEIMHDEYKAEDMVSEAFLRIAKNINRIAQISPKKMPKYLHMVIHNICIDEIRKRSSSEETYEDITEVADITTTESTVVGQITIDEIANIISSFPDRYKDILLLVYYYDHSIDEACFALGITANTAYQRLFQAKKMLKKTLAKEGLL